MQVELQRDMIVSGPFWPEPVRLRWVENVGDNWQIEAVGTRSGQHYDYLLPAADLDQIVLHRAGGSSDAAALRLALEAQRIRLAYTYDPHFAVSVSQIDPLPHQLEAVYHHLLQLPQIRFLLADDPGAGKTIMAGLLLKELKLRGGIERILIVAPAKLTRQWQRELHDKFHERFDLVDRNAITTAFGRNWWTEHNQVIASLDFIWPEAIQESLKGVAWDLVIVDEAHHMAAYRHGRRGKVQASRRYRVGEVLRDRTDHLLMLTATPHKGDPDNFALLMQLLDRDLDVTPDLLRQVQANAARSGGNPNPFFLRRLKEDMRNFAGELIFKPRTVETKPFTLTPAEKALYDGVTDYFRKHFTRASDEQNRPVTLALTVLQRRLASSLAAITKSLERRTARLREEPLDGRAIVPAGTGAEDDEIEDLEEMEEADSERLEDRLAGLTTAHNRAELDSEIAELIRLTALAKAIQTPEAKWTALQEVMESLKLTDSREKLLIFTEHRDTLDMLVRRLRRMGFRVTEIHGGLNMQQRIAAEGDFWHEAQLLVATEAAGEGINLQCAHLMINYDIPWNPTRLEQRMGRIHRYLQNKPVFIYNMVATDTIEGQVLDRLLTKLARMKEAMGNDRVYDVVSQILDLGQRSLADHIRDAILHGGDAAEVAAETERALDPVQQQRVEEVGLMALATRYMDLGRLQAELQESREQRLMPEYVERFFGEALAAAGGKAARQRSGLWQVANVPTALRDPALPSVGHYGRPGESYRYLTFHKADRNDPRFENTPELIGPGHALFEAVLDWIGKQYGSDLSGGALFYDPEASAPYLLWFLKLSVLDGRSQTVGTRIYALRQTLPGDGATDGGLARVAPAALIDLVPAPRGTAMPADLASHLGEGARRAAGGWAAAHLLPEYYAEMNTRRQHEVALRRQYLEFSLDHLRNVAQGRMFDAEGKMESDEKYRIAYLSAKQKYDELTARRTARRTQLAQEGQLIRQAPAFVTAVAVLPLPMQARTQAEGALPAGFDLRRNDEVERIAMEATMTYERRRGWQPADVSAENLGFDVRSVHPDGIAAGIRCIEVKGRHNAGGVLLTGNEWIKARRIGDDFWLYIVSNCFRQPQLQVIQNPAAHLHPEELQEIVRYFVPPAAWQRAATVVAIEGEGAAAHDPDPDPPV